MESDSGLLRWLKVPFLYNAFQAAVAATALRRRLIQNHVWTAAVIQSSQSGAVRRQCYLGLPDVEYVALNINQDCVAYTQRTYGARGTFVLGEPQSGSRGFAIHMSDESKVDA